MGATHLQARRYGLWDMQTNKLFICLAILVLFGHVTASSDYCTPFPNDQDITIDHSGNWFNITIRSTPCYICTETGGFMGDVDCIPCASASVDFSANSTCGVGTLPVQFTDISVGMTDWYWDLGDGNISTERHPSHTYNTVGSYTISHSGNGTDGTFWENKTGYLRVALPGTYCSGTSSIHTDSDGGGDDNSSMIIIGGFGAIIVGIIIVGVRMLL